MKSLSSQLDSLCFDDRDPLALVEDGLCVNCHKVATAFTTCEPFRYTYGTPTSSVGHTKRRCTICSLIRPRAFSSVTGWTDPREDVTVSCDMVSPSTAASPTYRLIVLDDWDIYGEIFEVFTLTTNTPVHSNELQPRQIRSPVYMDPDPFSQASQALLERWISKCPCAETNTKLPGRLLDLREPGLVKLLEDFGSMKRPEYVALSYRWAAGQDTCRKESGTYKLLQRGRVTSHFGVFFRDVFRFCRMLGYYFIWIDALCIIQDDELDVASEISGMADVFRGSILALCIADQDSSQGFSQRPHGVPVLHKHHKPGGGPAVAETTFIRPFLRNEDLISQSLWSSRGWTLQERALAPRKLILGRYKMTWECRERRIGEDDLIERPHNSSLPIDLCYRGQLWSGRQPYRNWYAMVEEATGRELTNASDSLPAVAGLARQFTSSQQFQTGHYVAGLWEQDALEGLAWMTVRHGPSSCPDSITKEVSARGTPSWSWAAGEGGAVQFMSLRWGPEARASDGENNIGVREIQHTAVVVDIAAEPVFLPNPYGHVKSGRVCIRGPLLPLRSFLGEPPAEPPTAQTMSVSSYEKWVKPGYTFFRGFSWDTKQWEERAEQQRDNLYLLEVSREYFEEYSQLGGSPMSDNSRVTNLVPIPFSDGWKARAEETPEGGRSGRGRSCADANSNMNSKRKRGYMRTSMSTCTRMALFWRL
ncbi:heterokaryon incompatibility protein-domain-containing protein [Apiospora arundinis]